MKLVHVRVTTPNSENEKVNERDHILEIQISPSPASSTPIQYSAESLQANPHYIMSHGNVNSHCCRILQLSRLLSTL